MNSPDRSDPQFAQWLRSYANLYGKPASQAEIDEYKRTHPAPRLVEFSPP